MTQPSERERPAPRRARHVMLHPWLSLDAHAALAAEAAARGRHPDGLAAALLDIVARDDLFAALLDR